MPVFSYSDSGEISHKVGKIDAGNCRDRQRLLLRQHSEDRNRCRSF
jgi:hypothetical protein